MGSLPFSVFATRSVPTSRTRRKNGLAKVMSVYFVEHVHQGASTISLPCVAAVLRSFAYPSPTCAPLLLGGSKTTVTLRLPQAGHMRRASSRDSGKFGPRVQTSVSRSNCLRYTQRLIDRVSCRWPLAQRICTFQPRLRATPSVSTSMRTTVEHYASCMEWCATIPLDN